MLDDKNAFRHDAVDKAIGRAKYSADFMPDGMLHAKVLWPAVPCARIRKLDISRAEHAPGVVRVVTRKDITGPNLSSIFHKPDRPILVGEGGTVRFAGDALALVAAETADAAERALDLIEVEYEALSAPHTVDDALKAEKQPKYTSITKRGDVEKGFAESAVVVTQEFFNPYAEHAYLEPDAGVAYVDQQGVVTVYVGSQDIKQQQRMACLSLGYPFNRVRIISPYVGGGFGSKHSMSVHVYLTLLAYLLDRPVSMIWTREEVMRYSCKKQSNHAFAELGLAADGRIQALRARVAGPCGPYAGNGSDGLGGFCHAMLGVYNQPNVDIQGAYYETTGPELGAFRGVGVPDGTFVIETMLSEAAKRLGINPDEIRRRNFARTDKEIAEIVPNGYARNVSADWIIDETLHRALAAAGELAKPSAPWKKTGRGIACAAPAFCIGNTDWHKGSVAELVLFEDRTLLVKMGFPEVGQGIIGMLTRTAAEALEIDERDISVSLSDTHMTPAAGALGFSQATVTGGNAVLDAAGKLKKLLADTARAYLNSTDESIYYAGGRFVDGTGREVLDWKTFGTYCFAEVKYLCAQGYVVGTREERILYGITPVSGVADVEVDEETGEVRVLQIVICHDSGKVAHYESARGQIVGGALMSMSGALMEEFTMRDGMTDTPSLAEYLIPTAMDVPGRNEAFFIEGNLGKGCPYGAKGMGEHGMHTPAPAIASAIHDAVGVSVARLPVTPERLLAAMGKL